MFSENQLLSLIKYIYGVRKKNKELLASLVSAGTINQSLCWERSHANTVAWSCDVEGTCEEVRGKILRFGKHGSRPNKTKVLTPCAEELEIVGELSRVCSRIVLTYLYFARIGRPNILWSVKYQARSIIKWNKSCNQRLARLISYIFSTGYRQYCQAGNSATECKFGIFQDAHFAGDLEDTKSTSGGVLCIVGSHTFVPISWTCKRQTVVSHSGTEAEIILLGAGLRLEGIPALNLLDLVTDV